MGAQIYPNATNSNSSYLPVNASEVLVDGQLVSSSSFSTTVNGNGGLAYLYAQANPANFTVGSNSYYVPAGSVVPTSSAVGSSTSVSVQSTLGGPPSSFTTLVLNASNYYNTGVYGVLNGVSTWVISDSAGGAYYSTNGTTWNSTTISLGTGNITYNTGIAFAPISTGMILVVSYGSTNSAYSYNGSTWTASTFPNPSGSGGGVMSGYLPGSVPCFVTYDAVGGSVNAAFSLDGINWHTYSSPIAFSQMVYGNINGTNYFMGGNSTNGDFAYSQNVTTWTLSSFTHFNRSCAYGNGVIVLDNGYYSSNLTTWNSATLPYPDNGPFIIFGGGYFLIGATTAGYAQYTTNGATWTVCSTAANEYSCVFYGNNLFFMYCNTSSSVGNGYFKQTTAMMPVTFGVYSGPSTIY